jgi:hypothetical protein
MHLDRRTVLRSLSTAAAAGIAAPRLTGAWRRQASGGPGTGRLGGFRAQGAADGDRRVSAPIAADRSFSLVGVEAPPGAEVEVRASQDGTSFGPWLALHALDVEGEGPDGEEARNAGSAWKRNTTPAWTGPSRWLQLRVAGADPEDIEAVLVEPSAAIGGASAAPSVEPRVQPALWRTDLEEPDRVLRASSGVDIMWRHQWGADESIRGEPRYADWVRHGVVHHTAGRNDYTWDEAPRIVNGIYNYHVNGNGWRDIGYNLLIDKFGRVYEGRFGGVDLPVIGAHAAGANTGTFGVALIGDFRWTDPPEAMRRALFEVLAWKFELHAIDPLVTADTSSRSGVPTLVGHRDAGTTATTCPGDRVDSRLAGWRQGLSERVGSVTFADIAGHPHEENIRRLRAAGVTNGYSDNTYRPQENVTRAQMATFIRRAAKLPPGGNPGFHDVASSHPHYEGIAAVAAAGIAHGRADGNFRPSNDVTRGQMASFLSRALELSPLDNQSFSDVGRDHPHYGTIEALAEEGVTLGRGDGTYRPDHNVTRGQMASFLVRAFDIPPVDEAPKEEQPEDDEGDPVDPDDPDDANGSSDDEDDDANGSDDEDDANGSSDDETVQARWPVDSSRTSA